MKRRQEGEEPVLLQWRKRRWQCRTEACPQKTCTEEAAELPARAETSVRLRTRTANPVEDERVQAEVATTLTTSWPTVQRAVVPHAQATRGGPAPSRARAGRDLPRPDLLAASGWRVDADGSVETGFCDLAGGQGLLAQGRRPHPVASRTWLEQRSSVFLDRNEVVMIDPHAGFARAVRELLPAARIAVDHLHLIMLADKAVTRVRQRTLCRRRPRR